MIVGMALMRLWKCATVKHVHRMNFNVIMVVVSQKSIYVMKMMDIGLLIVYDRICTFYFWLSYNMLWQIQQFIKSF